MHDTTPRRDHQHVVEGLGAPFQECKALSVPLKLELHVDIQSVRCPSCIDLHGMVNDQIDGHLHKRATIQM